MFTSKFALWIGVVAASVVLVAVFYWTAFSAWMTAYPLVDNQLWSYVFNIRVSLLLVNFAVLVWLVVRLARAYRGDSRDTNVG